MLICAIICALYQPGLKSFEVQNECVGALQGRTGGRRPGFKTRPGWWGLSKELPATRFPVNQRGFMETGPHGSRAGHVRKEARVAALCCLKDFFPFISAAQEGSCSLRFSSRRCWLLIPCLLLFFLSFFHLSLPHSLPSLLLRPRLMSYFFCGSHWVWKQVTLSQSLCLSHTHFPCGWEAGIAVPGQAHCSALSCQCVQEDSKQTSSRCNTFTLGNEHTNTHITCYGRKMSWYHNFCKKNIVMLL